MNDADFALPRLRDASAALALARRLYGASFAPSPGVLHVTALEAGSRRALKIDAQTPKSLADTFALNLARARADAIVITGKILRDEPHLSYAPGAPGPQAPAMRALRLELGLAPTPLLVVLTRGADLPLGHPVFHDGHTRPLVYGPEAGVAALRREAPCECVGAATGADVRALVALLRERGARTLAFEAGPSTTGELYAGADPLLDELCLSTYGGPPLEEDRLAGEAPSPPSTLDLAAPPSEVVAASGPWTFARYVRRKSGAASASI